MYHRRFIQWMYRGQRPHWMARWLNSLSAVLVPLGIGARYGLMALEVRGRMSGKTISLPVAVVTVCGKRYLVSMLGENVQWVKNVRAADGRAVLRSRRREPVRLEEIPAAQRAPILKVYLQRAPGARPHIPVDKGAPLADFERIAAAYPVFEVASEATPGATSAEAHIDLAASH